MPIPQKESMYMTIMSELMSVLRYDRKSVQMNNPFMIQRLLFESDSRLIIFDVGACVGDVTKTYRGLFPDAAIYCFEPFPDSFKKLEKLSSDEKIRAYQLAVSDRVDKTKLYVNADVTCNSFYPRPQDGIKYYPEKAQHVGYIEVDTTTIDNFYGREHIGHIDILKIDVEGAERKVLNGACDTLSKHAISLIYTEVMFTAHYEGGCLFHELTALLERYSYTLFNFYNLKRARNGQIRWGNAIFLSPETRAKISDIHSV